jgi:hypothetical protein
MSYLVNNVSLPGKPGFFVNPGCKQLSQAARETVVQARLEWLRKGASEGCAKEILERIHLVQGLSPAPVYHFGSPLAAMLAIPHLAAHHRLEGHGYYLLKSIGDPLQSRLGVRSLEDDQRRQIANELVAALGFPIEDQLNGKFLDGFTDRICGLLRDLGGDDFVKSRMTHGLFKTLDKDALEWWRTIASTGCWWWPYTKFTVVSAYPTKVSFDSPGRLHAEDGPAIEFPDGLAIWAWHGVLVSERMVLHPETFSDDEVQSEANAEIQRVMIERMGAGEYLRKVGAKLIDMDSLTLEGSAPRALMEDKNGQKWLVGTDGSTARVYTMSVPREARTCREAHRLIAGFPEDRLIAEA